MNKNRAVLACFFFCTNSSIVCAWSYVYVQSISGKTDSEMTFSTSMKLQILIDIIYYTTFS